MSVPSLSSRSIVLILLSCLCFAVMNVCIRYITQTYSVHQAVLLRNVFALAFLVPIAWHYGMASLKTAHVYWHGLRGVLAFIAMSCWFYSLSTLPSAYAVALLFSAPIFATAAAIVVYKEAVHRYRIIAIAFSFAGMLVITRPGGSDMGWVSYLPLVSAFIFAGELLIIRFLSRTDSSLSIVFSMSVVILPLSLPLGLAHWQAPDVAAWGWFVLIAVSSTLSQLFLTQAYAKADMTLLLPFDFMRLVFTYLLAYLWFGEALDLWAWVGGAMIVASSVMIARHERRRMKTMVTTTPPA